MISFKKFLHKKQAFNKTKERLRQNESSASLSSKSPETEKIKAARSSIDILKALRDAHHHQALRRPPMDNENEESDFWEPDEAILNNSLSPSQPDFDKDLLEESSDFDEDGDDYDDDFNAALDDEEDELFDWEKEMSSFESDTPTSLSSDDKDYFAENFQLNNQEEQEHLSNAAYSVQDDMQTHDAELDSDEDFFEPDPQAMTTLEINKQLELESDDGFASLDDLDFNEDDFFEPDPALANSALGDSSPFNAETFLDNELLELEADEIDSDFEEDLDRYELEEEDSDQERAE